MGEVRNGDQKVRKYLFSEIFYGRQGVFTSDFLKNYLGRRGQTISLKISSGAQSEDLEPFLTIQEFFSKKYIFLVLYAAYVYPFWVVSL